MVRILSVLCLGLLSVSAWAGPLSDAACEKLLMAAEEHPNDALYDDCGFGDENKAWHTWAPFASAHELKRSLFELCRRYPDHIYGPRYCDKVVQLNFGPALVYMGEKKLAAGQTEAALADFNQALLSDDLSEAEILHLMETLGLLYLDEEMPAHNPRTGVELLTKAANKRSAVANNALGYLVWRGQYGLKQDQKKALEFFWRAILYGCPAAEENLGIFHLARQEKIPLEEAYYYVSLQALTCQPFDKDAAVPQPMPHCSCQDVLRQEAFFQSQPYRYMMTGDQPVLRDNDGQSYPIAIGTQMPNGMVVHEITPTLVTLMQRGTRIFVNRYHTGQCVTHCLEAAKKRVPIRVRPYRLSFTQQECSDIDYYATHLIDTTQDYVGKQECAAFEVGSGVKILLEKK